MVSSFKTVARAGPSFPTGRRPIVRLMCAIVQRVLHTAVVDRCRCAPRPVARRNPSARPGEENGRCDVKSLSFCAPAHRARRGNGDNRSRGDIAMYGTRFLSRVTGLMRGNRRDAYDASPVLLGLAGFDGRLKFLNPAWEKILGYPAQELLDRPLRELKQRHGLAAVALVERLLADDGFEPLEFGVPCPDGTCRW